MSLMKVYLVDDEQLALKRLWRLLEETGRVELVGKTTDSEEAKLQIEQLPIDLLFADIEMPGLSGLELVASLSNPPLTIFATAYSQYALQAFETNSIDYLVKPVERERLSKALDKAEKVLAMRRPPGWKDVVTELAQSLRQVGPGFPVRVASKVGDKIELLELDKVTHFFSQDKLTWASYGGKTHIVDETITELEQKLDPAKFFRIHRSTLLNTAYVQELHAWVGGGLLIRLKTPDKTELQVARERVAALKAKLGL